jgi:hypothetical protein
VSETLIFYTNRQRGGVFPLLEVDDMIRAGPAPDWKCVFTYVNSIYTELAAPKKKPPAELNIEETVATDEGSIDNNNGVSHQADDQDAVVIDNGKDD